MTKKHACGLVLIGGSPKSAGEIAIPPNTTTVLLQITNTGQRDSAYTGVSLSFDVPVVQPTDPGGCSLQPGLGFKVPLGVLMFVAGLLRRLRRARSPSTRSFW